MGANWKTSDTKRVKPKHDPYKREKSHNSKREVIREETERNNHPPPPPTVYQQDQLPIEELPPLSYFDEVLDKMDQEDDNTDDDILL